MQQFTEDFKSINNKYGKIMLEHSLFGKQIWRCEHLDILDDDDQLGVRIQGHDICVYKNDIVSYKHYENMYVVADSNLTITIIMNKL